MARWVVKIGSSSLTGDDGRFRPDRLEALVDDIAGLRRAGQAVVLVSSGAVALGRDALGWRRPLTVPEKQAAAAVGQGILMEHYRRAAARHSLLVGQLLLSRDDFDHRERYLHTRSTAEMLLSHGVLPIINENDTVAVDEIRVGDNDTLAARVAIALDAERLVLLTDTDGLYEADPRKVPGARRIERVEAWDDALLALAGGAGTSVGTGGMRTKLLAARLAVLAGIDVIIARAEPGVLQALYAGESRGTRFFPARRYAGKKRWLAAALRPAGAIVVDAGARDALVAGGKSLLFPGIVAVEGQFDEHATVTVRGPDGEEIGRGISRFGAADLRLLLERRAREGKDAVRGIGVVIHRDDFVLTVPAGGARPSKDARP
ncbi:MAG: glutamate 5-kinase [Hydrogenibacillus schlegelii]|uniref:Glutamate 5-kinase n=1 Tax=Hydrogenibacillus schlegelii TaxID=1484 RepID=A0A947G7U5_HYDSH|nr:glutamate 5-kinase [Hydrogenibacillus schlegelii]